MTDRVVKAAEAVEMLRATVAKKGEGYVYPRQSGVCLYVEGPVDARVPGCIAGTMLVDSGLLTVQQLDFCGVENKPFTFAAARLTESGMGFRFTDAATELVRTAQREQDSGRTWGKSLKCAEDLLARSSATLSCGCCTAVLGSDE